MEKMPTHVSVELEIFYSKDHCTGVAFLIFLCIIHLCFAFSAFSICNSQ